ncbi:MAG TPA: hypothetical protein VN957_26770 [Chthoniobacterales bacterium]|nr:hypothetical protein [Chthoniobacterales bacterium]
MTKRSLLIWFFLRRRCLAFMMAGATLTPLTSFAQQYQETDQVFCPTKSGKEFCELGS